MILDILKVQNPADATFLHKKATDVTSFGEPMRALAKHMTETMLAPNADGHPQGCGLAGPQVGVGLNVFVMLTPKALQYAATESMVVINPYIVIWLNDHDNVEMEGCLSIPGIKGKVKRYKELGVIYYDTEGQRHGMALEGFPARVFQHEYDHLNGILFTDRTKDLYVPRNTQQTTKV